MKIEDWYQIYKMNAGAQEVKANVTDLNQTQLAKHITAYNARCAEVDIDVRTHALGVANRHEKAVMYEVNAKWLMYVFALALEMGVIFACHGHFWGSAAFVVLMIGLGTLIKYLFNWRDDIDVSSSYAVASAIESYSRMCRECDETMQQYVSSPEYLSFCTFLRTTILHVEESLGRCKTITYSQTEAIRNAGSTYQRIRPIVDELRRIKKWHLLAQRARGLSETLQATIVELGNRTNKLTQMSVVALN